MIIFKKAVELTFVVCLIFLIVFITFEPAMMKAAADEVTLTATVSQEVTISSPADTSFSASIPGVSGNPGAPVTASSTWTVITNNPAGFNLKLKASQANALFLDGTYYFDDYGTVAGTPDYGWATPAAQGAVFGFSVAPATAADLAAAFLDNGSSACGSGTYHAGACWAGFNGTTDVTIIDRSSLTDATGQAEVVNFRAESNARLLQSGNYTATITATAALN